MLWLRASIARCLDAWCNAGVTTMLPLLGWTLPCLILAMATSAGGPGQPFSNLISGANVDVAPWGERASWENGRDAGLWQPRFWEHLIRDKADFAVHMDYTHYNPVKHGYVRRVIDWPYSSFHRCVRQGIYAADWGDDEPRGTPGRTFGE